MGDTGEIEQALGLQLFEYMASSTQKMDYKKRIDLPSFDY